jgi:hypothetical protein
MAELARGGVVIPPDGVRHVWAEPEAYNGCCIPLVVNPEQVARNARIIADLIKRRNENPEGA